MAPTRAAFTKVVTTDTSATSLVVGGTTGSATTGTGGIIAGNAALDTSASPLVAPLTLRGGGAPGAYTLVNSGLVWKDAAGHEQWRLWGGDWNDADFNTGNLYWGYLAGQNQPTDNVTAGYYNVAIGHQSFLAITTGHHNTVVGANSAKALTTGFDNVVIGSNTLSLLTTGQENIAIGSDALHDLVTGSHNTAVGDEALEATTGNHNSGFGSDALRLLVTGDGNTAVGRLALSSIVTASAGNTALGYHAGEFRTGGGNLDSATNGVFLGMDTRAAANAGSNEIVIGYNADGHGTNTVTLGNTSATQIYGPPTWASPLAFSSALRATGTISPTQLVANTDNWAPTGLSTANVIRIDVNGNLDLTGLVAQPDGTLIVLYNTTVSDITIKNDATSTAANRFYCPNGTDWTLRQHASCWIRYDGTATRWTVFGSAFGS